MSIDSPNIEPKREVVNLAVISRRKLLLGYTHATGQDPMWIPLGGKRKPGEDDYACLLRELSEETQENAKKLLERVELFSAYEGRTPSSDLPLLVTVYLKRIDRILQPNSEIQAIAPFSYKEISEEPLVSEITRRLAAELLEK